MGEGVRVDMNKELKLLLHVRLQKKVEGVQSNGGVGVRVDANEELKLL